VKKNIFFRQDQQDKQDIFAFPEERQKESSFFEGRLNHWAKKQ